MLAGCPSTTVSSDTRGSGYQFVRFATSEAARAVANDSKAGPAVASNNRQCQKDEACNK